LSIIQVKELVDAGVHFGHRASRWNPKMAPYIYAKRNLIHIINLKETVRGLIRAYRFLAKITTDGRDVLFVGTKRQARVATETEAKRCSMHYVTERWLGGTLTNFKTIRSRLHRLVELEQMEADGTISQFSKKVISSLTRQRRKIKRNLDGLRTMDRLPAVMVVVDPRREYTAVREANKLGIPVVGVIDTDCDPDVVDIPIPANDDAMRSVEIVVHKLANAVLEGASARITKVGKEEAAQAEAAPPAEKPAPAPAAPPADAEPAAPAEVAEAPPAESGESDQTEADAEPAASAP